MGPFWALVFLFFNSGYFLDGMSTQNSRRPDVVNIGSIITFDSVIGKVAKVAIEAAIDDVNSNPAILGGTKLKLTMLDANYSGFRGIIEALQFMETNTVAIIGPQSSVTANVISHIANGLQVPLLSFAATDPSLSSLQYPFFVRTTQDDQYQMAAIADIVEYYEWREVVAIYTDDDYGRNGILALANQLATKRCRISYKAPMNPQASRSDIMDVMVKVALAESRILIVHTYPAVGVDVVAVAHHLGMIRSGYVLLATNWLSTVLDTYLPFPSGMVENIQGLITLRMYTPDSEMKTNFLSRWKNLTNNLKGNGAFGLNTYGLYAYDTVWILATAIDAFFNHGGNISFSNHSSLSELGGGNLQLDAMSIFDGGQLLLDSILKVKLTGLSGLISFTKEKSLIHPAYEVINVIGTGIRRIGYWSNYSGLSVVPPEKLYEKPPNRSSLNQQLHSVMWPGQTIEKPRGWVFPNNGKQLRIGVPNRVSYHEFIAEVPGTDMFKGYCIEVFTAALNLLPYAIPYKLMPFGDGVNNPSCTELVRLISTGVYDAAIGDIAITTNRTRMADFTQPYIQSGLVVVAPVRKSNAHAWAFLRPFTWKLWTVTGIFFLLVGVVVWVLEHRINDEFRGSPRRQIITILWFSFSTMFFSHRENTVSPLGRMVLIIWLFVVLIINFNYTASLTSILTVQQLSSSVQGIESLIASKDPIGYQQGSFARNYLSYELGIHESRLVPLNSEEEYAKALKDGPKKGGVAAVVDERAYMELFLSSRCEFSIIGQEFTNNGWGFAFPQDSPLAIDMSNAILKLSEAGELQRIHDKWLMRSACSLQGASLEVDRIQLKSFSGLFIICGLACLVALLVYFALLVCQFTKDYSESSDSSGSSSRSARIRTFLSFVKEKEEEGKCHSDRRQSEQVPIGITGENESSNSSKKNCTAESSNRRVSFRVGTK